MGEIVLVRHGQANSGATSEADYDRLSPLGHQQAAWLGDWLRAHQAPFDRVVSGGLRRHRETVAGIALGPAEEDARFNELDYFALAHDLKARAGVAFPGRDDWPVHMRQTFTAWEAGQVTGRESWADFVARVEGALADAARSGVRVLCVSSGGVIGMALCRVMGLGGERLAPMVLPVGHTSITRLRVDAAGVHLFSYNAVPHLETGDRRASRTWL